MYDDDLLLHNQHTQGKVDHGLTLVVLRRGRPLVSEVESLLRRDGDVAAARAAGHLHVLRRGHLRRGSLRYANVYDAIIRIMPMSRLL